ncbi:hypothetical protein C7M61_001857 [Candidozyma pseudohaemuli]|uniref:N-glycosylase/DNA lyase n=1 Tax=Candidozyma pseudohaemuli TaxID=418784 RepID=A0A2P7YTF9_9ASCO|nr:hypothetical protein C7M61_001857 [[Candida] pseudohaemulonii]PSK39253.1 hypothetical protein C7M61_001857 [[Candida] pseudohaemulonii]
MTGNLVWKQIPLPQIELSLARVLRCGQTFRWKNVNSIWSFTANDQIVLLKQDPELIHYACVLSDGQDSSNAISKAYEKTHAFIHDYFNLDVKLEELYQQWSEVELKYRAKSKADSFATFPGIRMLRQDPWETVILFICSSNNNVKRISKMCDALCQEFGNYINDFEDHAYYSFPLPEVLAGPEVEAKLRDLGFGYRAKYINQTAKMFVDPEVPEISMDILHEQRSKSYEDAHEFLLQLSGVGPKVADCICLMALDKHDVVPVDTHVLQIATRDYKYKGPKTMNKVSYHQVRLHLQELFGKYAGWAQLVMFAADLSDLNNGINQRDGAKIKHDVEFTEVKKESTVKTEPTSSVVTESVKLEVNGKRSSITSKATVKRIKTEA